MVVAQQAVSLDNEQKCVDFVRGCTFLATGGGGAPERGVELLLEQIDSGRPAGWVDPSDIADNTYTVSVFGMGGRPPAGHPTPEELAAAGLGDPSPDSTMPRAVTELATFAGVTIGAVVPIELGGANTPGPLVAAASLGILVPDGDYTGRAIPEITQVVPSLAGRPAAPLSSVDRWGNVCMLTSITSDAMAERIGKLLSQAAFGGVSMAGFLMPASQMREVLVHGTLSRCLEIGRVIREARATGQDPVEVVTQFVDGRVLFTGTVRSSERDDREGYRYGIGTHHIAGSGAFHDAACRVWYKNENHICWIDGVPVATSPDLICIVDADTAEPFVNAAVEVGQRVAVIGVPGLDAFRTPDGIDRLGPRHFGFDIDYVPLEQWSG